jgi:spore coat protein H
MRSTLCTALRVMLLPAAACLVLFCGGSGDGPGPGDDKGKTTFPTVAPQDAAASVFHPDSVYHFEVSVGDSLWAWLNAHILEEEYVSADVKVAGMEFKNVGIRYKGAYGTLKLCVDGSGKITCDKLSMKIRFDEYEGNRKFRGLKRLNLHSLVGDPTKLHDRLASHLFRAMGIPAARTSHATLSINGKSLGLFALVEQIDEEFAESRFPLSGKGNLYKEVWPQSTDPGPYLAALETNKNKGDAAPMTRFARDLRTIDAANQRELLAASVDVGYLLRYLAVDQAITNWDGATTFYCNGGDCRPHNLFWYQDDLGGKLWLIPWDFDGTFAAAPIFAETRDWNDLGADCAQPKAGAFIWPAGCDPLFRSLALYYQAEYKKTVEAFQAEAFDIPKLQDSITRWAAQIRPFLEQDPTRSQSMDQWKTGVDRLKDILPLLKRNAQRRIEKSPIVPFGLKRDSLNGFEGWLPIEVEGVVASYANRNSEVGHSLNKASSLSGSQDFRLGFTFRNESDDSSGAWKHYATSGLPFERGAATDLRGIRTLRFKAKADTVRAVRVDIASARYSNANSGVTYGWEVALGTEPQEYVLDLADLAIPSWGDPIPEAVAYILAAANGLQWSPFVVGRNGNTGLLEPGSEDEGFIQIDDIRFSP